MTSIQETIIPLTEERAVVSARPVERGSVRVSTHREEREELIRQTLHHQDVSIERVSRHERVEATPAVRQEGDTLILPIVEQVLVTEVRLMLVEEVRITRRDRTEDVEQKVLLRRMRATVERIPPTDPQIPSIPPGANP